MHRGNGVTPPHRDIVYSRHARRRMRWRRITEVDVEETIGNPDRLEATSRGRTNAFKWIANRHIRVTFVDSETAIVMMSVVDRTD
ncbi:MAG: DUF4258 domain-containing protein [Chloroflexi bacterium]|nr:DUF4258 domain-containing protein [Chloroflexota bacterium]